MSFTREMKLNTTPSVQVERHSPVLDMIIVRKHTRKAPTCQSFSEGFAHCASEDEGGGAEGKSLISHGALARARLR